MRARGGSKPSWCWLTESDRQRSRASAVVALSPTCRPVSAQGCSERICAEAEECSDTRRPRLGDAELCCECVCQMRDAGFRRLRNLRAGISAWARTVDPEIAIYGQGTEARPTVA
jgi:hypothetical protein